MLAQPAACFLNQEKVSGEWDFFSHIAAILLVLKPIPLSGAFPQGF